MSGGDSAYRSAIMKMVVVAVVAVEVECMLVVVVNCRMKGRCWGCLCRDDTDCGGVL